MLVPIHGIAWDTDGDGFGKQYSQASRRRATSKTERNQVKEDLGGVTTTTGQGTVEFVMARYWSMSLNSGVSRNQQLDSTQRYDVQFAGVALHRITGRFTNLFLSYDFQRQTTSTACTGPICGYVGMRNVFGIGFAWTYHPIGVE